MTFLFYLFHVFPYSTLRAFDFAFYLLKKTQSIFSGVIETRVISASLRGIVFTWFLTCVSVCEANRVHSLSGYCVFTEAPLLIRLASSRQSFYGNTQLCTARLRRCPRSGRSFESIFRACTHRARCCLLRVNGTHRVLVPLNSVLCFQHRPT